MKSTFKLSTYLQCVVIYFVLFYSTSLLAETFDHTYEVKSGGKLTIQTDVGSIRINTHSKDTVELKLMVQSKEKDQFSYHHQLEDGNLTLIGEIKHNNGWVRNLKVEFELYIPKDHNVDINTSGGSISVEDLNGKLDARTSGGSIRVGHITGDVRLHTSGGSISTDTITGNLNAHTSGGSIKVTVDKQFTQDAKLTTSGGSITAYLLADIEADIYASTSGGRVKSEFEINGKVKKRSIRGKINGGGPKLTLKTSGGSIKIKAI